MMKEFDIRKFVKDGKDLAIDLDEVESLVRDDSLMAIESGDKKIPLLQLFDGQVYFFDIQKIQDSLLKIGVVDYLDKRNK